MAFLGLSKLFLDGNDQRHVTVLENLDHAVLVEGDASTRVALCTLHMDEDVTTLGIDALLVEVGGNAVVILWLIGVHLLTFTLMAYSSGIDNLVVVLAVFVTCVCGGCHVDIGHRGAGIGLDAESTQWT